MIARIYPLALLAVASAAFAGAPEKKEVVSLYMERSARPMEAIPLDTVSLIVYPERQCNQIDIPNYQRMKAATLSRAPMCAFVRGDDVIVLSPYSPPSVFPNGMFAVAFWDESAGTATVGPKGFDKDKAMQSYMDKEREKMRQGLIGAPLPPRQ